MEFNSDTNNVDCDDQPDQAASNNNNNSDENSCDETFSHQNNNTSMSGGAGSQLKRKRLCDIAYTAALTFENQIAALQYVDSLMVWKFERNRPTKKGAKGFYHCRISENCKSKIYLLSDPLSPKVVLYQNNIDHEHDPNAPVNPAYLIEQAAKKSRMSTGALLVSSNNNTLGGYSR